MADAPRVVIAVALAGLVGASALFFTQQASTRGALGDGISSLSEDGDPWRDTASAPGKRANGGEPAAEARAAAGAVPASGVDSAGDKRTVRDLPDRFLAWLDTQHERSMQRLREKVLGVTSLSDDDVEGRLEFLSMVLDMHYREIELRMLRSGEALLISSQPPAEDGVRWRSEFCFVNGSARLKDGTVMRNARIAYPIRDSDYPLIASLKDEKKAIAKAAAWDTCIAFNSLPEAERRSRFETHAKLRVQLDEGMKVAQATVLTVPRSQRIDLTSIRNAMNELVPPGTRMNPKTWLVEPR